MGKTLKKIPLGIDNFKELIEKNTYFVDKSLFIKIVMENASEVIFITRPRRFGKTLNFSMLKYFLEIPACRQIVREDGDYLFIFKDLDIYKEKGIIKEHYGRYPVINFSFKKVKADNGHNALYLFKEEISREYMRHRYLLDTDVMLEFQKREYERIMSQEAEIFAYTSAIKDLSTYLNSYYNAKVIVLIDEYDTPLHYARLNGYYDEMLDIMRALMVDGMKGNDSLEKAVVTGIMKISQESIFSAFNNPKIATLTDGFCADQFGFTEEEVFTMLEYYGLSSYKEVVQEWYDGYLFGGNKVIYNPWSILSFIDNENHEPKTYWINTGDTSLIRRALQLDELKGKEYIEKLYRGQVLTMEVEQNIVYEEVFNDVDKALSYLLHAGYLKAEKIEGEAEKFNLSIPNREISIIYRNILKNWFTLEYRSSELIERMIVSLLDGDLESFEVYLQEILLVNTSYYDNIIKKEQHSEKGIDKKKYENFYHGLILGLMIHLSDDYYLESNKEYGLGRPYIVILPRDRNKTAYILEFKSEYTSSKIGVEDAARKALDQINEKKYASGLKKTGIEQVIKIGLGFKGKELKLVYED
jgi:hypothetical protein